jgi:hypothetical protein
VPTPVVKVFLQGLSRSAATAMGLLGSVFAGTVTSGGAPCRPGYRHQMAMVMCKKLPSMQVVEH